MSNICFNLNNTIDISNNYYIFNNVNNVIGDFLDGELLDTNFHQQNVEQSKELQSNGININIVSEINRV